MLFRSDFHEQMLLSIERNLGALVEAQQRTELRVRELAEAQQRTELRVQELAEAQQRTDREMNIVLTATASLAQATVENQRMLRDLGGRMDQLTDRMDQLAGRMDQLTGRMDQLAAVLQRFLESQTGPDGRH